MKYRELKEQIQIGVHNGAKYNDAQRSGIEAIICLNPNINQEKFIDFILSKMFDDLSLFIDDGLVEEFLEVFGEYTLRRNSKENRLIMFFLRYKLNTSNKRHRIKAVVLNQYMSIIEYLMENESINNECSFFDMFSKDYQMRGDSAAKSRLKELYQLGILKSRRITKQGESKIIPAVIEYRLMEVGYSIINDTNLEHLLYCEFDESCQEGELFSEHFIGMNIDQIEEELKCIFNGGMIELNNLAKEIYAECKLIGSQPLLKDWIIEKLNNKTKLEWSDVVSKFNGKNASEIKAALNEVFTDSDNQKLAETIYNTLSTEG